MQLKKKDTNENIRILYQYLKTRTNNGELPVKYDRIIFEQETSITPKLIQESINELVRKGVVARKSKKGECSYELLIQQCDLKETPLFSDSEEKKVANYVCKNAPVKHLNEMIVKETNLSLSCVKKSIKSLINKNYIRVKSVSKKGNCLMPTEWLIEACKSRSILNPTVYLVDTENANHEKYYEGIEKLKEHDRVILLLTQNSRNFSNAKLLHSVLQSPATIQTKYYSVNGKNALDFIIVSEACQQLAVNPSRNLCVISRDKGFDVALSNVKNSFEGASCVVKRKENFF